MKYTYFNNTYIGDSAVEFFDKLAHFESSNNYKLGITPTKSGKYKKYLGRYQIGVDILIDIGWLKTKNSKLPSWENSEFIDYPLKKWKIKNHIDFLNCEEAQDEAIMFSLKKRWNTIKKHIDKFSNYHIIPKSAKYLFFKKEQIKKNGEFVPILPITLSRLNEKKKQGFISKDMRGEKMLFTSSGFLAASHLCGQGAINNALTHNFIGEYGIPVDSNCLPSLFYVENLKGFDLSIIINFKEKYNSNYNVLLKKDSSIDDIIIKDNFIINNSNDNKNSENLTKISLPTNNTIIERLNNKFNDKNLYNNSYIMYIEEKTSKIISNKSKKIIEDILIKYDSLTKNNENIGYIIKQKNFDILREGNENLSLIDFIYYIFKTEVKNKNFLDIMEEILSKYSIEEINSFELNIIKKNDKELENYRCAKFIKDFENSILADESYKTNEKSDRKYPKIRQLIDNIIIEFIQIYCSFKAINEKHYFDNHKIDNTNITRNYLLWKVEHTNSNFLFTENDFFSYLKKLNTNIRITTILKYWLDTNSINKVENISKINSLISKEYGNYTDNSKFDEDKNILYSYFKTLKILRTFMFNNNYLNLYNFYKEFYTIKNSISSKNEFYVNGSCTLQCTLGQGTSKLIINENSVFLFNEKQANISNTLITPFASCSINKVCTPQLIGNWDKKTDVLIRNTPALLSNSTIKCNFGGIISIKNAGQNTIGTATNKDTNHTNTPIFCDCYYKHLDVAINYIYENFIKSQLYKKQTKDTIFKLFIESFKFIKIQSNPINDNMNIIKKYGLNLCDYKNKKFYNANILPIIVYGYLTSANNIQINHEDKNNLLATLNDTDTFNTNLFNSLDKFNFKIDYSNNKETIKTNLLEIEQWINIGKNIYLKYKINITNNIILDEIKNSITSDILCPFENNNNHYISNNNNNNSNCSSCAISPNDERAPWMKIALDEYNKYKGKNETEEPLKTKISTYHYEGANLKYSYKIPWCASFVNWCLKKASTPNWASASSQSIKSSKNMKKITEPLYGAIINLSNYNKDNVANGQGHSSFLIGESIDGKYYIGLGGNQGNQIKLSKYPKVGESYKAKTYVQKFEGLYWPINRPIKENDKLTKNDKFDPNNLTIDKTR